MEQHAPPELASSGAGSEMVIEPVHFRVQQQKEEEEEVPPLQGLSRYTHNAKWLLFWMCWASAVQGMVVNGFVNTSITSIEKRFDFKSRTTGLIAGSYDIACLVVCVPMSYLGSRPGASKPRWLGFCIIIMGLGSFLFVLPHFLVGPYDARAGEADEDDSVTVACNNTVLGSGSVCLDDSDTIDLSSYKYVFILGQVLQGIGAVPIYTIGVTFIDESVSPRMSSMYLGIFYAMAVVGPALGFGLGGQFLKYYVDTPNVDPDVIGVTSSSTHWIGAWWIGFFISGTAAILLSIPILLTPAVIPKEKDTEGENTTSAKSENIDASGATAFQHLDGFKESATSLLKNFSYLALSVAESTEGFVLSGLAAFMPKLIESQFNQPSSLAAMLVGAIAIPAGGGGTFLGGWIIKKYRLTQIAVLKMCLGVSILNIFVSFALMQYCSNNDFAGVNVHYEAESSAIELPNLESQCNIGCGCEGVSYNPVCGANGVIYYSPCHAGCASSSQLGDKEVFNECSCVSDWDRPIAETNLTTKLLPDQAVLDLCPSDCNLLIPFLLVLLFLMFLTFIISMPNVSATLRCVDEKDRGLALGLQGIAFRVIGTIPAPILFGVAIDNSCVLWQDSCGTEGACVTYDNYYQSRYILALVFAGKILATFSFFVAWWTHIPRTEERNEITSEIGNADAEHDNREHPRAYDNPALNPT